MAIDEEDKEADKEYIYFDNYMSERRKSIKEKQNFEKLKQKRTERPTIRQTFSDLRTELKKLNADDWEKIPEIKDFTTKKRKIERYTPLSDSQIISSLNDNITPLNLSSTTTTTKDIKPSSSSLTNKEQIENLSKAKNSILSVIFDKMSSNVSGQTSVNPSGYITEMSTVNSILGINQIEGDINDIKKVRLLLKSSITANPNSALAWIASARVEEIDSKKEQARELILKATSHITNNEDLWLEAARLHNTNPQKTKDILNKGLSFLPKSEKMWLALVKTENDINNKKSLLMKALQSISSSEKLWKMLIELESENESNAKEILYKATQCVPYSINMWLALAKLEDYKQAKKVLNKALKQNPNSPDIWIHGAMLEEANASGNDKINHIITKSIDKLENDNVLISNEEWFDLAIKAEQNQCPLTAQAIAKCVIVKQMNKVNTNIKQTFLPFADKAINEGCIETVKSIYLTLTTVIKGNDNIDIWQKYFDIMLKFKTTDKGMNDVYTIAINQTESDEQKETLWLLYCKEIMKYNNNNNKEAINIMTTAYNTLKREKLLIKLIKLLIKDNQLHEAYTLINNAIQTNNTSVKLHKQRIIINCIQHNITTAIELITQAITLFPNHYQLYIMHINCIINQHKDNITSDIIKECIDIIKNAIKRVPTVSELYIELAKLLMYPIMNLPSQARAMLEKGLNIKQATHPDLLLVSLINLEIKLNNINAARFALSKGIIKYPQSGVLWAIAIALERKSNQHAKALDALTKCPDDPVIMTSIANLYFVDNDEMNAKKWYDSVIRECKEYGDAWMFYYKMIKESRIISGNDVSGDNKEDMLKELKVKVNEAQPNKGILWKKIRKLSWENYYKRYDELLDIAVNIIDFNNIFDINE